MVPKFAHKDLEYIFNKHYNSHATNNTLLKASSEILGMDKGHLKDGDAMAVAYELALMYIRHYR